MKKYNTSLNYTQQQAIFLILISILSFTLIKEHSQNSIKSNIPSKTNDTTNKRSVIKSEFKDSRNFKNNDKIITDITTESYSKITKRCSHNRKHFDLTKHYTSDTKAQRNSNSNNNNESSENSYNNDQFLPIRFYFDYSNTLPEEEEILKQIIMPPVQEFFESTLRVKRTPGKLRFPSTMTSCQSMDVPLYLINDGVDADIVILVSTFLGMKKRIYESILKEQEDKDSSDLKESKKTDNAGKNDYYYRFKSSITLKNNIDEKEKDPWNNYDDAPEGVIGWASRCVQDNYSLRPVGGVVQFVDKIKLDLRNIEETVWTAIHELSHVLVFDFDLFYDFIDGSYERRKINDIISVHSSLEGFQDLLDQRKHLIGNQKEFLSFNSTSTATLEDKGSQNENINDNDNDSENINQEEGEDNEDTNDSDNGHEGSNDDNRKNKIKSNRIKTTTKQQTFLSKDNVKNILSNDLFIEEEKEDKEYKKEKVNIKYSNATVANTISSTHNKEEKKATNSETNNKDEDEENNVKSKNTNSREEEDLSKIKLNFTSTFKELIIPDNFDIYFFDNVISDFAESTRIYVKSPKVLEITKSHYNCSSCHGMELEHFGGLGSAYSHWSKRMLNTDFMIADVYGEYYISNITLALFEDSGWYQIDYKNSQEILWGKNQGCEFVNNKCIYSSPLIKKNSILGIRKAESESSNNSSKNYKNNNKSKFTSKLKPLYKPSSPLTFTSKFKEFCQSEKDSQVCSISHKFRGHCRIIKHDEPLPYNYQYYNKENVGGISPFGDFCPFPIEWMSFHNNKRNDNIEYRYSGSCQSGVKFNEQHEEKICNNCRCFNSNLVNKEKINEDTLSSDVKVDPQSNNFIRDYEIVFPKAAVCYQVFCKIDLSSNSNYNRLPLKMSVLVGEKEFECPYQGGVLTTNDFYGEIECPHTEEICVGDLNPLESYDKSSSYYLLSGLKDRILDYFLEKNSNK